MRKTESNYPADTGIMRLQHLSPTYREAFYPNRIMASVKPVEDSDEGEEKGPVLHHIKILRAKAAKLKQKKSPEEEALWRYVEEIYLYYTIYNALRRHLDRFSESFMYSMEKVLPCCEDNDFILDLFTSMNLFGNWKAHTGRIMRKLLEILGHEPIYEELHVQIAELERECVKLRRKKRTEKSPSYDPLVVDVKSASYLLEMATNEIGDLANRINRESARKLRQIQELGLSKLHQIVDPHDSSNNPYNIFLYAISGDFENTVRALEKLLWYDRPDRFRDFYNENRKEGAPDFDELCDQAMETLKRYKKKNPVYFLS
ncbi:hypothetical protein HOG48_00735 [Candidatus Peregrinibacteria bacterium]|jgi:hypothetical protein|nr:hypothetical protein [Candidatus Peregrinibacteria bacterium]